jgi:hypothetical protein
VHILAYKCVEIDLIFAEIQGKISILYNHIPALNTAVVGLLPSEGRKLMKLMKLPKAIFLVQTTSVGL